MTTDITPIVTSATKLAVTDQTSMIQAGTVLGKLKDLVKTMKKEEDSLTETPLKEVAKVRAIYKPKRDQLKQAIDYISREVNTYQTEQARIEQEKKDKLAARVQKGTMRIDTAAKKSVELETTVDRVDTSSGTIKFRTVQELRVTDKKQIPLEYLVVDEKALTAALKAGKTVPGAELIDVKKISNYAK